MSILSERHTIICRALQQIFPNGSEWVLRGDSLDKLEWLDTKNAKPSNEDIEAKIKEIE